MKVATGVWTEHITASAQKNQRYSKRLLPRQPQTNGESYCSFAYSALASFNMGMSESASFQRVRKSWYATFAFVVSPSIE
jgi:hypothetical protein